MKIKSKGGVELTESQKYSEEHFDLINGYIEAFKIGTLSFNGSFDSDYTKNRNQVLLISGQIQHIFGLNSDEVCKFAFSYHEQTYLRMGIFTARSEDHLYFLTDGNTIKIGRTGNPKERLSSLQVSNSNKLRFIKIFHNRGDYEFLIHAIFYELRLNGEWFKDDGQIRSYIRLLFRNNEDLSNEPLFYGKN